MRRPIDTLAEGLDTLARRESMGEVMVTHTNRLPRSFSSVPDRFDIGISRIDVTRLDDELARLSEKFRPQWSA